MSPENQSWVLMSLGMIAAWIVGLFVNVKRRVTNES